MSPVADGSKRRRFAGILASITIAIGAILAPSAAYASPPADNGENDLKIARMSDQEFTERAMSLGEYEVGEDGSITIYDTRPLYRQAAEQKKRGVSSSEIVSPMCIACVNGSWKATRTAGPTRTYGGWTTRASGWGPATLSQSVAITQSNSYTGTLAMSQSAVNAAVGFSITYSTTVTSTYTGNVAAGRQGFLQTRPAYDNYTVKQEYFIGGSLAKTTYIYPKKYAFTDHRIAY